MGGVGFNPPQRGNEGRGGAVSQEMLQSWLSKLGAGVRVHMLATAQTITTGGSAKVISWIAAPLDTHGFWTSTAPTLLTVPRGLGGVYLASGAVRWEGHATGYRTQTMIVANTSGVATGGSYPTLFTADDATDKMYPLVTQRLHLSEGDTVSASVYQNSTASIDIEGVDDSFLQITRVGDLPKQARFQ